VLENQPRLSAELREQPGADVREAGAASGALRKSDSCVSHGDDELVTVEMSPDAHEAASF
jgi:tRNA A58 N-methylase Trm61